MQNIRQSTLEEMFSQKKQAKLNETITLSIKGPRRKFAQEQLQDRYRLFGDEEAKGVSPIKDRLQKLGLQDQAASENSDDEYTDEEANEGSSEDNGSDSSDDDDNSEEAFVPRKKMLMFKEAHGAKLRGQKRNPLRFTKGTTPFEKDVLKFVLADNVACPQFFSMQEADVNMTITTCQAAIHDSNIPISEYMRKEFFYRAFQRFS